MKRGYQSLKNREHRLETAFQWCHRLRPLSEWPWVVLVGVKLKYSPTAHHSLKAPDASIIDPSCSLILVGHVWFSFCALWILLCGSVWLIYLFWAVFAKIHHWIVRTVANQSLMFKTNKNDYETALGELLCVKQLVFCRLVKGEAGPVSGSGADNVGEERIAGLSPLYLLLNKSIHTEWMTIWKHYSNIEVLMLLFSCQSLFLGLWLMAIASVEEVLSLNELFDYLCFMHYLGATKQICNIGHWRTILTHYSGCSHHFRYPSNMLCKYPIKHRFLYCFFINILASPLVYYQYLC